jgi:ACR3 family arsenite efflux pump ArsB
VGDFFSNIEGWFTRPVTEDISPRTLAVMAVLLTVVVIWTLDGYRILAKMAEKG